MAAGDTVMSNKFKLSEKKSATIWPVGTGDSTTLVLRPGESGEAGEKCKMVMQIDLHHLAKADREDEPEWAIVDELVRVLPKKANGRPYLAVFALTHPDKDHVLGFAELLNKVDIGEIWHTPRIFRDQSDEEALCDDAKAFRKEAHRRRKKIGENPQSIKSGDRLRVIGHDDVMLEEDYKKLPDSCKSRPGHKVSSADGVELGEHFQAFVHAPFKEDQAKDRNNTSLALNIVLWEGKKYGQFFFFGDREYPTIKRIFEITEEREKNVGYLSWDVMLCAHHCSKAVMHWQDEGDKDEMFKKDIMDYFKKYSRDGAGYIVASSHSDFTDGDGDNPPHKKARKRYEEIVKAGRFICVHEYPSKKNPEPLVFTVDSNGFAFDDKRTKSEGPAGLAAAVTAARGGTQPPGVQVGFGAAP